MKISCSKQQLTHAVQSVQKAIATKSQLSILTGIYISASEGKLELQATDYELGISCTIDAEVIRPGKIVLSGKYFQDLVRKLPGNTVELETSTEDRTIRITSNKSQYNLLHLPPEEFPVLRHVKNDFPLIIKDSILKEIINKTVFACSNDEARPIFTGALLIIENGSICMVATNTHRMAYKKDVIENGNNNLKMIIPAKILTELARLISLKEESRDIKIYNLKSQVAFVFDDLYIISRTIEGQFPDYNRVIPTEFATNVTIKTADFQDAVERVALVSSAGDYNVIKLDFQEDSSVITSNNPDVGKAMETVATKHQGKTLEIAFNAKYITDILKNIETPEFVFSLNLPLSPACIKPVDMDDYTYVITPVRTS